MDIEQSISAPESALNIFKTLPPHLQQEVAHYAEYIRLRHLNDNEETDALLNASAEVWDND